MEEDKKALHFLGKSKLEIIKKCRIFRQYTVIQSWLTELSLFVLITAAVFISSGFRSAVVICTNKESQLPFFILENMYTVHCIPTGV